MNGLRRNCWVTRSRCPTEYCRETTSSPVQWNCMGTTRGVIKKTENPVLVFGNYYDPATQYEFACPNSPGMDASLVAQQARLPIVALPSSMFT